MKKNRMNFKRRYSKFQAKEATSAIEMLLADKGVFVNTESFTYTCINALFEKGVISKGEFEELYRSLIAEAERLN